MCDFVALESKMMLFDKSEIHRGWVKKQIAFRILAATFWNIWYVSGKQKDTLSASSIYDVRINGVEVTAPLRNFAQRWTQRTEAESHFQNWLWQQVSQNKVANIYR